VPGLQSSVYEGNEVLKAVIFDIDGTLIDSVDLHAQSWLDKHVLNQVLLALWTDIPTSRAERAQESLV